MTTQERLAAALDNEAYDTGLLDCVPPDRINALAAAILAADPQLAADAELGAAWRAAEAALPEGALLSLREYDEPHHFWGAEARQNDGAQWATGPTPTAALEALTQVLTAHGAEEQETDGD